MNNSIQVQRLENTDDLGTLIRGDAVEVIFQNQPSWKYGTKEFFAAYHGITEFGHLQFLEISDSKINPYIITYKARISKLEIRDGKIVIDEDKSVIESVTKEKNEYPALHETLQLAHIR